MPRLKTVILAVCVVVAPLLGRVRGHARLLNPPSRASKWRMGFSMPAADYDDNQGYCGGRSRLWNEFKGKCGVCGDAFYPIPRAHERGGRYYSGEITKTFKQGDIVEADVEVTANHRGWFEFKICPYDNPAPEDIERGANGEFIEVTQRCLDKHPIPLADGSGYRYELPNPWKRGIHTVKLRLPYNLICRKCLFQWKYNTGNSWGKATNGSDCMGCGHQEQFYSCADVQITTAAHGRHQPPAANGWTTPTTWSWDRAQRGQGQPSRATPSFWTRVPGVPGWRQNPAFSASTTSSPTRSTPKARFWPWWFFDKDAGWFNRDVWAASTTVPTQPPTETWDDWTHRPQTTRIPFWNRWFLDQTTKTNPRNMPLIPNKKKKQETKNKLLGFWERVFSRARQTIWSWLLKGRKIGNTSRRRQKTNRRTTTTTTTTTPRPTRTTTQWWKWWEHDRRKTTTPAPKYRSWWDSWPWARVWDDDDTDGTKIRPRPRWRPRTQRTKPTTTTTTTESWSSAVEEQEDWHNYNNNDMGEEYDRNDNENYGEASSEVAQITSECYPMGIWTSLPGMKQWCLLNCAAGFCPHGYCSPGCSD